MTAYDPEQERRQEADRQRQTVRRLEAMLDARRDAVARAERTLHDANLVDFRTAMTALFEAHPALETVAIEQVSRYNDEFTQFGVEDVWVNGQHAVAEAAIVGGYDAGAALSIFDTGYDGFRFVHEGTDDYGYPKDGSYVSREALEAEALRRAGPAVDLAPAVRDALRELAERYGVHFFWDLFGPAVTVHVDRDSIRITDGNSDPDAYSGRVDSQDLDWIASRLGPLTEPYLTSPERRGAAGLRAVYTREIAQIEGRLLRLRLYTSAKAVRSRHRRVTYPLTLVYQWGRLESVGVGGAEVPVWARDWVAEAEPTVLPVLGARPLYANRPALTPEEAEAALRRSVPTETADAALEWIAAIDAVRRDYGTNILRRLRPETGPTHTFP